MTENKVLSMAELRHLEIMAERLMFERSISIASNNGEISSSSRKRNVRKLSGIKGFFDKRFQNHQSSSSTLNGDNNKNNIYKEQQQQLSQNKDTEFLETISQTQELSDEESLASSSSSSSSSSSMPMPNDCLCLPFNNVFKRRRQRQRRRASRQPNNNNN